MNTNLFPAVSDIVSAARFITRLPGILRHPISSQQAHAKLQYELSHREDNFLALARTAIYDNPTSPYRRLLLLAGCEYGDLDQLVRKDGLEEALHYLYTKGIYLTVDESKGREPVVRGNTSFQINPKDLHNPSIRADLVGQSGGSRSPGNPIPIQFTTLRGHAMELLG